MNTIRRNARARIAELGESMRALSIRAGHDGRWLSEAISARRVTRGMTMGQLDEVARLLQIAPWELTKPNEKQEVAKKEKK